MIFGDLLPWRVADLGAFTLLLLVALWLRYTAKRDNFVASDKRENAKGAPPTFPYVFPLLGNLPISYLWKPREFVLDRKYAHTRRHVLTVACSS